MVTIMDIHILVPYDDSHAQYSFNLQKCILNGKEIIFWPSIGQGLDRPRTFGYVISISADADRKSQKYAYTVYTYAKDHLYCTVLHNSEAHDDGFLKDFHCRH